MKSTPTTLFKQSLLVSSIALALTACGGGSSSSSTEPETVGSESLSGTVADGYLVDATVCLDINENKVCDEGEPTTTSTAGGEFTIEGATAEQLLKPLIVKVIAGVTSDEDGIEINSDYSLAAPAGYTFVSPLTTMVQQELENNDGFDLKEAESSIKAKLGTDLNLSDDYVAAKTSTELTQEQRDEFKKIHQVAQVTATVIQQNMDAVKEAISGTDITFDQVLDLVVAKVLDNLETINEAVEQEGDSFTIADITTIANTNAIDESEQDSLVDEIDARKAEKQASAANLMELISTVGINWFDANYESDGVWLDYGTFSYNQETGESTETSYHYDSQSSLFVQETEIDDDSDYLLTTTGWVKVPETEKITVNSDGTINIVNAQVPAYAEQLEALQFDVSGLNIAATMEQGDHAYGWAKVVDPTSTFSDGALGFKLKFTTINDMYEMWDWDGCEVQNQIGGMCNSVWSSTGDGKWETDGPAVNLSDLISSSAADTSNPTQIKGPQVAWFGNASVYAEMLSNGTVNYYLTEWSSTGEATAKVMATDTWSSKVVNGVNMYVLELPISILDYNDHDYDERFVLLTEFQGYVRRGSFTPAGSIESDEVVFNQTARNDIVNAFRGTRLNDLATMISSQPEEEESNPNGGQTAPEELKTVLTPCATGDTAWDEANDRPATFSTISVYQEVVSECKTAVSNSRDFTSSDVADMKFAFSDEPTEMIEFLKNGTGVIHEKNDAGIYESFNFEWTISNGQIVLNESESGVLTDKVVFALIETTTNEFSVKAFYESDEWSSLDGNKGEIWSVILIKKDMI